MQKITGVVKRGFEFRLLFKFLEKVVDHQHMDANVSIRELESLFVYDVSFYFLCTHHSNLCRCRRKPTTCRMTATPTDGILKTICC